MDGEPILKVEHVSKKIGDQVLVEDLSFAVFPGEVFGLLGPNGAGKTTLIRMIVGLMSITEGEVWIRGARIRKQFEEAARQVGAIVENPEFYPFLTGYKNLLHFAGMVPGVDRERIDEVVSLVKLKPSIHQPVKTYSLGMRQRLGVAQALLHEPTLLVLDEPTNGLDPAGIRELRQYLRYLAREKGVAVLVSSHLLSEMELMCDRVAILQKGRLVDVRSVGEKGRGELERMVQFEVNQTRDLSSILQELGWSERETEIFSDGFAIRLAREEIARLNIRLANKGVHVYGIRTIEKTLEERFLEMTESDRID
ncbi:ABC transporter ATP-binding protein [Kroppenstedtia eburnea]|uniref:ABC transporter ATP-binding protein n=1 Tax=Kroppenstedtia eburnea TaxID=714067 RepID=UPI0036356444